MSMRYAYDGEPKDSCPYIDSVISHNENKLDEFYNDFSNMIRENVKDLEVVRGINESLREDNREMSERIAELEEIIHEKDNKITELEEQLLSAQDTITRLEDIELT